MSKISKPRKISYYIGMIMIIIGFILFISVFFSVASFMGDPFLGGKMFSFGNAVIGMLLMIVGSIVMNIGARGAAGSGILLDPEQAREDLKPFHEAKGGMINDVISNIDALDQFTKSDSRKELIRIRCRNCGALNEEDAKFCKACGKEV